MNIKHLFRVVIVVLAALALTSLVAAAQDNTPVKGDSATSGVAREAAPAPFLPMPGFGESEPNDSRQQADFLTHDYWSAARASGLINFIGDADYFEFYGLVGDHLVVSVAADRIGSGLDSVIQLYNQGGNLLAENDDASDGDLDSYLTYTLTSEGYFFLRISDYEDTHSGADHWYDLYIWAGERTDEWYDMYAPGDEEPNNTKAQAYPVRYSNILSWARIDNDGDVDYYKFDGKAGDVAQIWVETTGLRGTLESRLTLYNSAGATLASCDEGDWGPQDTNCYVEKLLPKTGTYYLTISDAHNKGGESKVYWLTVSMVDPYEPNNTMGQATNLTYGQPARGIIAPGERCDFYRFYAQAGDYVTILLDNMEFELQDSGGAYLTTNFEDWGMPLTYTIQNTGWYYLPVCGYAYLEEEPYHRSAYELILGEVELYGVKTDGKVGALTYGKGDILAFFPAANSWALFFDGSDEGVKTNLLDFDVIQVRYGSAMAHPYADWVDYLLLTFNAKTVLPNYPTNIVAMPQDIVQFEPYELGEYTSGRWNMYLDGSDIGLTTSAEMIDALDFTDDYWDSLYFSTTGRATVVPNAGNPPFTAEDEDLIDCGLHQQGENTVANCRLYFDGSAAGIPATADIAGVWFDPANGDIHLTFTAATTINGVKYLPNDVAICRPNNYVLPLSSCTWQPKAWVGNNHGLTGKFVDGLSSHLEEPYE